MVSDTDRGWVDVYMVLTDDDAVNLRLNVQVRTMVSDVPVDRIDVKSPDGHDGVSSSIGSGAGR
jgi:hypothetical protein